MGVSFDTKTMYSFEKYLELQHSGEVNMASKEARERLGIGKDEHLFLIENYSALLAEFKELKVVDELLKDAKARVEGKGKGEKSLGFHKAEPEQEE